MESTSGISQLSSIPKIKSSGDRRKIVSGIIFFVGYILSPASWWNDIFVNFPISYLLALPFGVINKGLFIPAFIIIYWLTDIAGVILMHVGFLGMKESSVNLTRREIIKTVIFCLFYTLVIVFLIQIKFLQFPTELFNKYFH